MPRYEPPTTRASRNNSCATSQSRTAWPARERAAVIALVRDVYATSVQGWADGYVADDLTLTGTATWEQLYGLTDTHEELAALRQYMADKSVNLRPAFAL